MARIRVKNENGEFQEVWTSADNELSSTSLNPVQNKVIYKSLEGKVDKIDGKGLSTNDFTNDYKSKLDSIAEGAGNNNIDVDDTLSDASTNPVQNRIVKKAIDALQSQIGDKDVDEQIGDAIETINKSLEGKVDKIDGSRLITSSESDILESLAIGDNGQIEISGTINASNVQGLSDLLNAKVDKVTGKDLSTNDYTTADKTKLAGIATGANKTIVDTELLQNSTNPVQNKAVYEAIDDLNKLISDLVGDSSVSDQISQSLRPNGIERYALAADLADTNRQISEVVAQKSQVQIITWEEND